MQRCQDATRRQGQHCRLPGWRYDDWMKTTTFLRISGLALALGVMAGCGIFGGSGASGTGSDASREKTLTEQGTRPLSGAQTQALLGKTQYQWEGSNGARGIGITYGDGNLRIAWESGAINGKIRFTNSGYCSRFKQLRNNREDCYRLYPNGPNRYSVFRTDGHYTGLITIVRKR